MRVILQADQRQKQNHRNEILPAHPQELFLLEKELGPMLNHEHIQSPIIPRMRRTSSRRSISLCPVQKWKMHHHCSKKSEIRMSRYLDTSTKTNGLYHGPAWKIRSFLLSEICTVILWQDCYGNTVGRRFPIGNAFSYTVNKGYTYLCMWMTSNWLERNKTLIRCWKKVLNKEVDLGEPTSFLDHV